MEKRRDIHERIANALSDFVMENIPFNSAIGFSGGIDSSLLLYLGRTKLVPYNVSLPGSRDYLNAELVSKRLGLKFKHLDLSGIDVRAYVDIVRRIDPQISKADLGYETVLAILLDRIDQGILVTGQGSDEIFYGYRRFMDQKGLTNEGHMQKLLTLTLPRERKIAEYFGRRLIAPYLESGISELLSNIPKEMHVSDSMNKLILRRAAVFLGFPQDLAQLPKKAAQYGSGILKLLGRYG